MWATISLDKLSSTPYWCGDSLDLRHIDISSPILSPCSNLKELGMVEESLSGEGRVRRGGIQVGSGQDQENAFFRNLFPQQSPVICGYFEERLGGLKDMPFDASSPPCSSEGEGFP